MAKDSKKTKSMSKWLIVIAILVVLAIIYFVLFTLQGPITYPNPGPTTCFPNKGFSCSNLTYYPATKNITVTLSQDTGSNWSSTEIIFVPENTQYSNIAWNSTSAVQIYDALSNRNVINIRLPINDNIPSGSSLVGALWARYTIPSNHTLQYTNLALVELHAS